MNQPASIDKSNEKFKAHQSFVVCHFKTPKQKLYSRQTQPKIAT